MQMEETLQFFNRALLKNADIKKQQHKNNVCIPIFLVSNEKHTRTKSIKHILPSLLPFYWALCLNNPVFVVSQFLHCGWHESLDFRNFLSLLYEKKKEQVEEQVKNWF